MIDYFDTHFHVDAPEDLAEIIPAAAEVGVSRLLLAGASVKTIEPILDAVEDYPGVYSAAGVHPHEAETFNGATTKFQRLLTHNSIRAVGEIGLDYFYDNSPRQIQREVFAVFLDLANDLGLPVIVHIRDAHEDAYEILEDYCGKWRHSKPPFVVHCFSGDAKWAKRYIDLGGYISFTGILTFPRAEEVREAMREVPLDHLMFETDSPYLAPVPMRGKKNQPAYLPHIVEYAAEFLGIDVKELAQKTTENGIRFFAC